MHYDVIILGGGPSGLFCASNIKNKKVLLLEKNEKFGKKLLVSGGGKCNFTNNDNLKDLITHYGNKKNFVKKALYNYSNIDLLKDIDFEYTITEEGKIFPKSMKSFTVLNWLLKNIEKKKNIIIKTGINILDIKKDNNKEPFIIKTQNAIIKTKILILATGGKSFPALGTKGDGYNFAKKFGHNIIHPKPALTPLIIKDFNLIDLAGTSMIVTLKTNNNMKFEGNLLFTHKGFSGPVVLNASRYLNNGDIIKLSFVPFRDEEEFRNDFFNVLNKNKNELLYETLRKRYKLTKRFISIMFHNLEINNKLKCNALPKKVRNKIINYLYNHTYVIEKLGDFNVAMVTKGGIDTKEINSKTMESKLVKNLYFIGEIIDVDGDTGGYNIQWAFSSAKAAADDISKK
ncbi:NAD(P)/FAD-dependent oxidoreductase [Marinitoga lauensis]|uniref:NAD(P)/FAD-dependent oxidoreductase n=1 Tax=Marinitoga lauensis TaxID=2201189 RepID=UPI001011CAF4|nr:aminoacetone oxidase family FAD-binding enzyme [Marinitoga lauensis]